MNPVLLFLVRGLNKEYTLQLEVKHLIHGGNTTRYADDRMKERKQLEAFGIPAPPGWSPEKSEPGAFELPSWYATTDDVIEVCDEWTSAEVEVVMICDDDGNFYVTVGSDQADRDIQRVNMLKSRVGIPKPIAREVWLYEEVKGHWNGIEKRSWAINDEKRELYQESTLEANLSWEEFDPIVKKNIADLRSSVIFCGTGGFVGSKLLFGRAWDLQLHDPVLNRTINHHYDIKKWKASL